MKNAETRPRSATIKDVARAAGVSAATVSRALRDSRLISPETAERVKRAAQEVHYTASALGRGLVTGKSRTIGVVVTTITDPFIGEIVSGVEDIANQRGYTVLLASSQADPHRELSVVRSFQERRVDGVLLAASRLGERYVQQMAATLVPIVLINRFHPGNFIHSVMIDNVAAAIGATRHLIDLGHRRIAYLGDQFGMQSDTDRFAGYREALAESDLPFTLELVAHGDGRPGGGLRAMRKLLSLEKRPTAVFCYNDLTALGALQAIDNCKLRVPRDISLVGFDDLPIAAYTQPPLTTVRQPMHKMGCQAMELLLKVLGGEQVEGLLTVQGELTVRASTARPPR